MENKAIADILWVLLSAALVFVMQAGFLCLETGMTRSKNNINVALKNLADFGVSTVFFWAFGYALMFGFSQSGWFGNSMFFLEFGDDVWRTSFFFFQVMFCGTTVTILSGAIAERIKFNGYLIIAAIVSGLIYPVFGHWVWNGAEAGTLNGWLAQRGFVDFAGSTVVHSVGGWAALAILLIVGPRAGRFPKKGAPLRIAGADIPLSTLGVFLLWVGWFGFNGGSTLAFDGQVPRVLSNTILAGGTGMIAAMLLTWYISGRIEVDSVANGVLAGLVAITANAHAVNSPSAAFIGFVGGAVMVGAVYVLEYFKIDDAVNAIPVHLAGGIWGTLAVALFGRTEILGTGLNFWVQLQVQVLGILVCFVWTFGLTYLILFVVNRFMPLRVSADDEHIGLNVSEHGASTELLDLFKAMDEQSRTSSLSVRVPVEPFTEIGQIARRYNQVMDALEEAVTRISAIVRTARDGIITFSKHNLRITAALNPAAETIFGYTGPQLYGQPLSLVLLPLNRSLDDDTTLIQNQLAASLSLHTHQEMTGRRADGTTFPVELTVAEATVGTETFYIGTFRDISARKEAEIKLAEHQQQLEQQVNERTAELTATNRKLRHEIAERKQVEAALLKSREQFRQVASSISDHIYMTEYGNNDEPLNRYLSPNVTALTGYPLAKFKRDWAFWPLELIHPDDQSAAAKQVEHFRRGEDSEVEYRLERQDGEYIWVRDSGRVVKDTETGTIIVYGVVANITARKQIEAALAEARDQAVALSDLKSQLLATVSHELRTPLSAIMGFAEMLKHGVYEPLADGNIEPINEIIDSARYLTDMVNSLLDEAQLEAGKLKLEIDSFEPTHMIEQVMSHMRVLAEAKGLELTAIIDENLPPFIDGDATRLRQVLVNLVGNAVKFTDEGAIQISVAPAGAYHWQIKVVDNGPGIPAESQPYIFEPFRQVDGSATRMYGGSGLGLSIVKQLVELMGGEIALASVFGKGSTFTITLPLKPILQEQVYEQQQQQS